MGFGSMLSPIRKLDAKDLVPISNEKVRHVVMPITDPDFRDALKIMCPMATEEGRRAVMRYGPAAAMIVGGALTGNPALVQAGVKMAIERGMADIQSGSLGPADLKGSAQQMAAAFIGGLPPEDRAGFESLLKTSSGAKQDKKAEIINLATRLLGSQGGGGPIAA